MRETVVIDMKPRTNGGGWEFQPQATPKLDTIADASQLLAAPDRVARINELLKTRDGAEEAIAAELRAELDARGEKSWLAWCREHWGWKRSAAYKHLDPKQMAKRRAHDRQRMSTTRGRDAKQAPAPEPEPKRAVVADVPEAMRQIVDRGFKELAKTLHPDKGGQHEPMALLNAARNGLTEAVEHSGHFGFRTMDVAYGSSFGIHYYCHEKKCPVMYFVVTTRKHLRDQAVCPGCGKRASQRCTP